VEFDIRGAKKKEKGRDFSIMECLAFKTVRFIVRVVVRLGALKTLRISCLQNQVTAAD
jgi:hypothetical protein